jgi:hypothetical protein
LCQSPLQLCTVAALSSHPRLPNLRRGTGAIVVVSFDVWFFFVLSYRSAGFFGQAAKARLAVDQVAGGSQSFVVVSTLEFDRVVKLALRPDNTRDIPAWDILEAEVGACLPAVRLKITYLEDGRQMPCREIEPQFVGGFFESCRIITFGNGNRCQDIAKKVSELFLLGDLLSLLASLGQSNGDCLLLAFDFAAFSLRPAFRGAFLVTAHFTLHIAARAFRVFSLFCFLCHGGSPGLIAGIISEEKVGSSNDTARLGRYEVRPLRPAAIH